jgi:uncharacterized protein YicC (UPF0701 family)
VTTDDLTHYMQATSELRAEVERLREANEKLSELIVEQEREYAVERKQLREERDRLADLLRDLHAEVEMAESVGICLPDRVPSLRAGQALASLPVREDG